MRQRALAPSHPSRAKPPAIAVSTAVPKRARIASSNAASLRNQTSRVLPRAGEPGAPNQKSSTSSAVASMHYHKAFAGPRGAAASTAIAAAMQTSYRNIFLLACCQALLLTNAAGLISMNGLVGYSLVDTKTIATLGATTYVLGSALTTMPMSLWMARVGRRRGFMAGALINIGGCGLAVAALWLRSFPLYCLATAVIGIYNAVGLQYRFAATEVAAPADKARAISLVLAGGIVGGFLGPAITRWGRDLFAAPFLGSFMLLAARGARGARRAVAGARAEAVAGRAVGRRVGRCRKSCGNPCSSSPRWRAGWATAS